VSGLGVREAPFEVYKAISQQIREIFAEHTAVIEPLSLDEVPGRHREHPGHPVGSRYSAGNQGRIKTETGLNASAGIS
jgi:DNA polymerase-4